MTTPTKTAVRSVLTRRDFIARTTLAAGAATLAFPYVGRVLGANERLNIACIGVGGKGDSDSSEAAACGANIVAICDVDKNTLAGKAKQFESMHPRQFQDYRKMFQQMEKDIDAVTVSTPDHHHGPAAIMAMRLGKHCFCQKPLTQTIAEARTLRTMAREKKLATQMGNQGSANSGLRRSIEIIQAGILGKPLELHVWTNRPIWPQGLDRPAGADAVPGTLDWDTWIGPAPMRPFKNGVYHTFNWRGWYDFGTGALGDIACHSVNMPFRALKLGYPVASELEVASRMYDETFPKTSRIRFDFPEREGLPPLKFWWYDGNPGDAIKPLRPEGETTHEIYAARERLPEGGTLMVFENGKMFFPDDGSPYLIRKGSETMVKASEDEQCKAVPQTIERLPGGPQDHQWEWQRMIKEGKPAFSNFEIAGYLTEVILLGCVALRVGVGHRVEWDGPNMKSPNTPEAEKYIKRNSRPGWEV
jgi:hypothetical protein